MPPPLSTSARMELKGRTDPKAAGCHHQPAFIHFILELRFHKDSSPAGFGQAHEAWFAEEFVKMI
jgi:hypothetical protein